MLASMYSRQRDRGGIEVIVAELPCERRDVTLED